MINMVIVSMVSEMINNNKPNTPNKKVIKPCDKTKILVEKSRKISETYIPPKIANGHFGLITFFRANIATTASIGKRIANIIIDAKDMLTLSWRKKKQHKT